MKKIYTTLMLVLIASISFAQISTVNVRHTNDHFPFQKRTTNTQAKAGAGSWWYSYADDLAFYTGTELTFGYVNMLQDSVGTIEYTSGNGRPQFFSFLQVFDFNELIWADMYNGLIDDDNNPIPVPNIGGTSSYTIDSVSLYCAYLRGENVPENIVDTLVVTMFATSNLTFANLGTQTESYFKQAVIGYNIPTATIASPSSYPISYQVKYPLTMLDTTSYFRYKNFPITGFENMNHKTFAVAFSFISGTPNRTLNMVIGTDINRFVAGYNEDPRVEYSNDSWGSAALLSEKSNSMCAMEYSFDPDSYFHQKYVSNTIWGGNLMRPSISVHATCNDCAWVGVAEADQKNISVRPNPATDNFTVTLVDNTNASIQLYNIVGQMVYNQTTSEQAVTINVSDLTSGIYMLKVSQSGKTYTTKVVVK